MPTGTFDLDYLAPSLAGIGLQTGVYLYVPAGSNPYTLLPNVQWLRIDYREGPNPPAAQLQYIQDDNLDLNLGWRSQFEDLWPIDTGASPYVLRNDDRIVILATNPDNSTSVLFDGFAQIPQTDVSPSGGAVTIAAVGVAARCFDDPIAGRVQRNSDPTGINTTDGSLDFDTDLSTRFNPSDTSIADGNKGGYIPNCSPDGKDTVNSSIGNYPVFIDPGIERSPDPRAYWSIAKATKYILAQYNADQKYVKSPTFATLDTLLQANYPVDDGEVFDPAADDASDILIRDYDANNKPWPEVLSDLLSYGGFVMRFDTGTDSDGVSPRTDLKIYRRDAANTTNPKRIYLDSSGAQIDSSRNNVTQLHLARDCNSIANAWQVETSQRRVEVSVLLAPLYQPAMADATAAGKKRNAFWKSTWTSATSADTKRKYRWYGVDELGEGIWTVGAWSTGIIFHFSVFPDKKNGEPGYVARYRPGQRSLISLDSDGHPLHATLEIAVTTGHSPRFSGPGDSDSTWQTISHGWKLLEDRFGIEVTIEDPEEWSIGKTGTVVPGGQIKGITWWANPPATLNGGFPPMLRLTTVIEDDFRMPISAPKRIASPTKFSRWRVADARDHFQYNSVDVSSIYYTQDGGDGTDPYVVRDDTDAATTHAKQLRASNEMPKLAGSVSIPFISRYYEVGDRLWKIGGRGVSLQTNIGSDQGEAPEYPWIVGVSWTNDNDRQRTVLQLSDHRAEPPNL